MFPIECNILDSFKKFRNKYFCMNENFLQAKIVNNPLFLRENPGRAANPAGCMDRSFFGPDFYKRLQDLKMDSLIVDGSVVPYQRLVDSTNIPFTQAVYLGLITAGNYAVEKYAGKNNSNGTNMPMKDFVCRSKKGSKRFRRVLEKNNQAVTIENLRVVQTFFRLVPAEISDPAAVSRLHCIWTWHFLSNRQRFFAFQFHNNSLGTKTRIAARYQNGGNILDQRCTFCVKAGSLVPMREDFMHVFYDCPYIAPLVVRVYDIYFKHRLDEAQKKLCYMTGIVETYQKNDKLFYVLTSFLINYTVWQWKLKKMIPSIAKLTNEVDYLFYSVCFISKKIENMALTSTTPVCRRWRDGRHGRG